MTLWLLMDLARAARQGQNQSSESVGKAGAPASCNSHKIDIPVPITIHALKDQPQAIRRE